MLSLNKAKTLGARLSLLGSIRLAHLAPDVLLSTMHIIPTMPMCLGTLIIFSHLHRPQTCIKHQHITLTTMLKKLCLCLAAGRS